MLSIDQLIPGNAHLSTPDMRREQLHIPFRREVHPRRICLLTFDKANAHDISLDIFQEEPDALETARVPRPPTRTRDAAGEVVGFVPV